MLCSLLPCRVLCRCSFPSPCCLLLCLNLLLELLRDSQLLLLLQCMLHCVLLLLLLLLHCLLLLCLCS